MSLCVYVCVYVCVSIHNVRRYCVEERVMNEPCPQCAAMTESCPPVCVCVRERERERVNQSREAVWGGFC